MMMRETRLSYKHINSENTSLIRALALSRLLETQLYRPEERSTRDRNLLGTINPLGTVARFVVVHPTQL